MEALSDSVNGSSGLYFPLPPSPPLAVESLPPDIEALRRLSANFSSLFLTQSPNFSDFTLVVRSHSLALHRCVLSARSPFFHRLFAERNDGSSSKLELGEVLSGFEVGYEALVLVLGYVYSGKVGPLPMEVCECADAECGHEACWPAVDFMLQVLFASATFEISELVSLFQADVNRKNLRGYSVIHVAAKRKEPEIIMCLLDNGARSYDLTPEGRKAIQISKRLTKAVDYYTPIDQGKDAPKDRLCIEILGQAERRPPSGEACNSVAMAANELLQKLLYLEIRVHMAKLLYPMEARVAMINAHVDGTSEFSLAKVLNVPAGKKGPMVLSEIPFVIQEEHLTRMRALSKTVELGTQYFPRCSEVLSRLLDHDTSELIDLENNTTEVRRKRYLELQEEIMEAFLQDKKELDGSVLGSASSKSAGRVRGKSAKKC